jgi:hypothetical protein
MKSIEKRVNSNDFRLISVTPREGSLILVLVICIVSLAILMEDETPEILEWFREHKEGLAYWTGLISNILNILDKIAKVIGWFSGGSVTA